MKQIATIILVLISLTSFGQGGTKFTVKGSGSNVGDSVKKNTDTLVIHNTRIIKNTDSLVSHNTRIGKNNDSLISHNTRIGSNTSNIATNTSNISSNTASILLKRNISDTVSNSGVPTIFQLNKSKDSLQLADSAALSDKITVFVQSGGTLFSFGDSYTAGTGATTTAKNYVSTIDEAAGTTASNQGVGGDGVFNCFKRVVTNEATAGNNTPATLMIGFNDITRNKSAAAYEALKGGHRAIFANHFLKTSVAANNGSVTTSGTWTTVAAGTYNDKASISLSGLARTSSVSGSTLTYTFTGNNIVIGYWGCDNSTFTDGRFSVSIDAVVTDTINPANKGVFLATQDPGRNNNAFVKFGLNGGTHTLVIRTLDNIPTLIDYIGTLKNPNQCAGLLVGGLTKRTAAGYALQGATYSPARTDADFNLADYSIRQVINEFPNYPIAFVNTNKYYIPATDVSSADSVHPNDLGHAHIAQAFIEKIRQQPQAGSYTYWADPGNATLTYNVTNTNTSASAAALITVKSSAAASFGSLRSVNDANLVVQAAMYGSSVSQTFTAGPSEGAITTNGRKFHVGSTHASGIIDFFTIATSRGNISSTGWRVGDSTAAASTLDIAGSFSTGYVAKTSTYTATSSDNLINCTSGTFTVTLPTAVGITGREYWITNPGSGTITIGTTSSQTFTNVTATPTTLTLAQFTNYRVVSTGANWLAFKIVN